MYLGPILARLGIHSGNDAKLGQSNISSLCRTKGLALTIE
uniref:Uncharacterized protein n=1 Tax=Rhizophora mucronata TaxID=61149 RepID=A0A2P2MWN8_RHIMU